MLLSPMERGLAGVGHRLCAQICPGVATSGGHSTLLPSDGLNDARRKL